MDCGIPLKTHKEKKAIKKNNTPGVNYNFLPLEKAHQEGQWCNITFSLPFFNAFIFSKKFSNNLFLSN